MKTIYDMGLPHPMATDPKLIINAAVTGMVPTKKDTPHVPILCDEIVSDAVKCCRAGASIIHIHARDENGEPACEKERYELIIKKIREQCPDVVLCVSTSGRVHNSFEKRSQVLELSGDVKPDMASLTMGSMNFPNQASINTPEMIQKLALKMKEKNIVPEIEIFETGMIGTAKVLIEKQILAGPYFFNLLLGSIFSAQATLFDLSCMVMRLPPDAHWGAAGIGRFQQKMNYAAMLMGGHVRVGLEDNIYFDPERKKLATNEMLINRIVNFAADIGREIASPSETREMIGLS